MAPNGRNTQFSKYFTHRPIADIEKVWGGWSWFSLHREAVNYLLDKFDEEPEILERCHYTDCVDELIFNSLLMQADDLQLVNDNNWRFIEWHPKRNCSSLPMILRETEYEQIIHTDALFVRKVSLSESSKLLELLDQKIEKEELAGK